jgi:hypothetical protein
MDEKRSRTKPAMNRFRIGFAAWLCLAAASVLAGCQLLAPPVMLVPLDRPHETTLPQVPGSLRFAVIGDGGTGGRAQHDIAARMSEAHRQLGFELVLMLGDNIYGRQRPADMRRKFEEPYRALLEAGVRFYASLGNHDSREQRFYQPFNMGGETYYSFRAPRGDVRFFALESDFMDARQLAWVERELREAREAWKIAFFHHPLYSSGRRHGSALGLRERLEPLFVAHGVSVVFAGHEHFYERIHPQDGITHFISGAAGKLRRGNIRRSSPLLAAGYDETQHFMLVEIDGDRMHFEAVSRTGRVVDSGTVWRRQESSVDRHSVVGSRQQAGSLSPPCPNHPAASSRFPASPAVVSARMGGMRPALASQANSHGRSALGDFRSLGPGPPVRSVSLECGESTS